MSDPVRQNHERVTRRTLFGRGAQGIGTLALASLMRPASGAGPSGGPTGGQGAAAAAPSPGEQALLQKANVLASDPNIRSVLGAENGGHSDKERSFANQLMFWKFVDGKVDDTAAPLRVEDPEAWMAERKTAIEAVTGENSTVVIKADKALLLPGIR